jgi:ATP synthase protein I
VNAKTDKPKSSSADDMAAAVRKRQKRLKEWLNEDEPSGMRYVSQIGVLGWIIVVPTLIGLFIGRWLDYTFGTGVFWSAPLLLLGAAFGFWSAWRWMHKQ